jgi:hypothetical protein
MVPTKGRPAGYGDGGVPDSDRLGGKVDRENSLPISSLQAHHLMARLALAPPTARLLAYHCYGEAS